jgi:hypothetical protein
MRVYKSRVKNCLYLFYRIIGQVFDPIRFVLGLYGYFWFVKDAFVFKSKDRKAKILSGDLFPMLHDKKDVTPVDAHYFYQQIWCFDQIRKNIPAKEHVDIGSSYELCGYISLLSKTVFVDLRPISTQLENLSVIKGDILNLPFPDDSLQSVSCLHVVEHIGLGRYGDVIDPKGSELACRELVRVLAPGGRLYFSLPIGYRDRVCFNAHRVHSPQTILRYFEGLKLVSFNIVDDNGHYKENVGLSVYPDLSYGCGMFLFEKSR